MVVAGRVKQVGAYCRLNKEEKQIVAPYGGRLRQVVIYGKWSLGQVGLYITIKNFFFKHKYVV